MFLVALNRMVVIWFFVYGLAAYVFIKLSNAVTSHYDGLEAAFGILLFSFIVYIIFQGFTKGGAHSKDRSFDQLARTYFLFFLSTTLLLLVEKVNHFDIVFRVLYIPVFTFLLVVDKRKYLLILMHFALFSILINLNLGQEYFLDSKERIFLFIFFPFLVKLITTKNLKFSTIFKVGAMSVILIVLASMIVNSHRHNSNIEASQEVLIDRFTASVKRFLVIDTLAGVVQNENGHIVQRPTQPSWTVVGSFIGFAPWVDSRPVHSKEMLSITKYSVSHNDVRIASTVFGHLLWSYGLLWLVPSIVFFWAFYHVMIIIISSYSEKSASMAYIAFMAYIPRLEGTADAFLSSILLVTLIYSILSLYFRVRWN